MISTLVLGGGAGVSHTYSGIPSTSLVLEYSRQPMLMIDVGFGSTLRCINEFGYIPKFIFITHNHSDHAAELPVILANELARGRKITVIAEKGVASVLRKHRLAELYSSNRTAYDYASWIELEENSPRDVKKLGLSLTAIKAKHSEPCFGLVARWRAQKIFAYSGDSGYEPCHYQKLKGAESIFIDARAVGSKEHASIDDVKAWTKSSGETSVFITGHGLPSHECHTNLVTPGQRIIHPCPYVYEADMEMNIANTQVRF